MDLHTIMGYLWSALFPLVTFFCLLVFTMVRGRRAITSLIMGLYFALLISLKFPYYEKIDTMFGSFLTKNTVSILVFAGFTLLSAMLMDRLLFYRIDEGAFQSFPKKVILALLGTILIMAYSFHVLPVTTFVDPGQPANMLFGPADYFFWWLMIPLVGLFFL